jgi:hypothetical protein
VIPKGAAFVFWIAAASLAAQQTAEPQAASPTSLLNEAYSIAANSSPQERAYLLMTLAQAASDVDPALVRPWSLELFAFANKNLAQDTYRAAMQKNALTALCQVDPNQAAELFTQLDPPGHPLANEDLRSFAARTLFPKLWEADGGLKSLEKIERIANWLGETGQYPYSAMAGIIRKTAEKDHEKAASLFSEAVAFLPRDPGFFVTNRQFVDDFLLQTWKIPETGVVANAITVALASIEAAEKAGQPSMRIDLFTTAGKVALSSQSDYLVYRLLPIVASIDMKWAAQLRDKYTEAGAATPDSPDSPAPAAMAMVRDGAATDSAIRAALDGSAASRVSEIAASDPQRALQIALSISDPASRASAMAAAMPAYSKVEPAAGDAGLQALAKQLETMQAGEGKLRLTITLADAYAGLGRDKDAAAMMGRALDLGEEIVSSDLEANPGKMVYQTPGFTELNGLVGNVVARPSLRYEAVERVRHVGVDTLRAHLTISVARGLAKLPASDTAP